MGRQRSRSRGGGETGADGARYSNRDQIRGRRFQIFLLFTKINVILKVAFTSSSTKLQFWKRRLAIV